VTADPWAEESGLIDAFPAERIGAGAAKGREVLLGAGLKLEPSDVAIAVERHRWAWKPERVRVLLIAESHVYTSDGDFRARIRTQLLPPAAQHAPVEYVRLVYCLGYGESRLLTHAPAGNGGTWQFWNLFGRLVGTGRQPTRSPFTERLAWKIATLHAMRDLGVWLLDASLHAIYMPGATRVPPQVASSLHRIWWRSYGAWLLDQHRGAYLCAVGAGVSRVLAELGVQLDNWVYQPQARAVDHERGWDVLQRAVAR